MTRPTHPARPAHPTRPMIGITTYREPAAWGPGPVEATLLPAAYIDAVRAAGGTRC